jgi:transposase
MSTGRTGEFRKEAVRIALTSGLSRRQVADDLGVGFSTLNKWVSAYRGTDVVSGEDRDLARENERLRREVRILKEERDILKKAPQFFASQKPGGSGSSKNSAGPFRLIGCEARLRSGAETALFFYVISIG